MDRRSALAAIAGGALVSVARADYTFVLRGEWPANWPKELEPLRTQSRTLMGPLAPNRHYGIHFTKREEFEAAWPHLLKVKSKGGGLHLMRGGNFFLGGANAGVVVHAPPSDADAAALFPKGRPPNTRLKGAIELTEIELVVDGSIVDLNRIILPPDTMITDDRFKPRPG